MRNEAASIDHSFLPAEAREEWVTLTEQLDQLSTVPCRTTSDPEAWWPVRGPFNTPATMMAIDACGACPARTACLAYAVAAGERFGIWGGTLPDERRALRWRTVSTWDSVPP